MKNAMCAMVAAGLLFSSSFAFAQSSCEAPVTILSDSNVAGSTCGMPNAIGGYGPYASPQPDYVYSFIADGASATITMAGSPELLAFLVASCSAGVAGPAIGSTIPDPNNPMIVEGLTDGQQYWIGVTSQPGADDACGDFTLSVDGTLPVSLQEFSID